MLDESNTLCLCALLLLSGQANPKQGDRQSQQDQSKPSVIKPAPPPPQAKQGAKGCPGTAYPHLNCDAISANAAVEQVRHTADQNGLMRLDVWGGFLTLLAAGIAAYFAKSAATAGHNSNRPWIVYDDFTVEQHSNLRMPDGTIVDRALDLHLILKNTGVNPAMNVRIFSTGKVSDELPEFEIRRTEAANVGGTIGNGQTVNGHSAYLYYADLESLRHSQPRRLYLYALIAYQDPASLRRELTTEVCMAVYFKGYAVSQGHQVPIFEAMPAGPKNYVS